VVKAVVIHPQDAWTTASLDATGESRNGRRIPRLGQPDLTDLLSASPSVGPLGCLGTRTLPSWRQRQDNTLGDSAHPMLPFLGQGARPGPRRRRRPRPLPDRHRPATSSNRPATIRTPGMPRANEPTRSSDARFSTTADGPETTAPRTRNHGKPRPPWRQRLALRPRAVAHAANNLSR